MSAFPDAAPRPVLEGAPRPAMPAPVSETPRGYKLAITLSAASLLGFPLWIAATFLFTPLAVSAFIIGVAPGFVVWVAMQPFLKRSIRGRSTSRVELLAARVLSFIGVPFVSVALAWLANGAFDHSRERVREFSVTSVKPDDDNVNAVVVDSAALDPGVERQQFRFDDPEKLVRVGQTVRLATKRGALGFEWEAGKAEVEVAPGVTLGE